MFKRHTGHLHARWSTSMPEMVENNSLDAVKVSASVHVFDIRRLDIKLVVRTKVLVVLVDRNLCNISCVNNSIACRKVAQYLVQAPYQPPGLSRMPNIC